MSGTVIIGAGGQLGRELSLLFPDSLKFSHSDSAGNQLDLTRTDEVRAVLSELHPDIILNAAALANVDLCEENKKLAFLVNGESIKTLVTVAREIGSLLVHVSTDYVFDGENGNYREDSVPNPLNYYGLSKLIGDAYALSYENAIVVRTSGVFGYSKNFPLFVFDRLRNSLPVTAIKGYYSPIHAKNLAKVIGFLYTSEFRGVINVAGERKSRYDLAINIAEKFDLDKSLVSEKQNVSSMNATRPFDSSLDITVAKRELDFDFHSTVSNLDAFEQRIRQSKTGRV